MAQSTVKKIQRILEVKTDGVWGPKSQKALNNEIGKTGATGNPTLAKIQKLLGVKHDGFWGPKSQQTLNDGLEGGWAEPTVPQGLRVGMAMTARSRVRALPVFDLQ